MGNWQHTGTWQGIRGPAEHFHSQGCCDNYISSGDNLERLFPSAVQLLVVFPVCPYEKKGNRAKE